jgi:hypothetical protein
MFLNKSKVKTDIFNVMSGNLLQRSILMVLILIKHIFYKPLNTNAILSPKNEEVSNYYICTWVEIEKTALPWSCVYTSLCDR